ncbi:hypothetical protein E2562_012041 [Oryza meyeriana var. granulata]|uniref:Uncharacterized protein n=1 Tax=Oryza meyeriana var. granulata TaxID=110450 RepID=A0A6G1D1M2_9ORYZ|nr:hypothetical protein E2562_012041 [Oryza meyeriana var. granulata]
MAGDLRDLASRPEVDFCVVAATGKIERLRERFTARSVVAWSVDNDGQRVELSTFADEVRAAYRIRRSNVQEPRLVTGAGREFHFGPWTERLHSEEDVFRFRVRLCIEGVPMHARTQEVAAKIVGRRCAIQYVEEYSQRRNYNRSYDLWAWTSDPNNIPKAGTEALLDLLEHHLDRMLHEASIQRSMYSPDTNEPHPASPVFAPSVASQMVAVGDTPLAARTPLTTTSPGQLVDAFLSEVTTLVQQPMLPIPDAKQRRPCCTKHFKKLLSPSSMKTIAAIVEKGGCKNLWLRAGKKSATMMPV